MALLGLRVLDLPSQRRVEQVAAVDENLKLRALLDGEFLELLAGERGGELGVVAEIEELELIHVVHELDQTGDRDVGQAAMREDEGFERVARAIQNWKKRKKSALSDEISCQVDNFERVVVIIEIIFLFFLLLLLLLSERRRGRRRNIIIIVIIIIIVVVFLGLLKKWTLKPR